eukprot:gene20425-27210_t
MSPDLMPPMPPDPMPPIPYGHPSPLAHDPMPPIPCGPSSPLTSSYPYHPTSFEYRQRIVNNHSSRQRADDPPPFISEQALLFEELRASKNEPSPAMQPRHRLTCTTSQRLIPSNVWIPTKQVRMARGGSPEDLRPKPILHNPDTASQPRTASTEGQRPLPSGTATRIRVGSMDFRRLLSSGRARQEGCPASRRRPVGMNSLMSSQELSLNTMSLNTISLNAISLNTMSLSSGTDSRRRTSSMMKFLMAKESRVFDQGTPWGCARMVANMSASSRRMGGDRYLTTSLPTMSASSLPTASASTMPCSVHVGSFSCGQMNEVEDKLEEGHAANETSSLPARVVEGQMEGGNGLVEKEVKVPIDKTNETSILSKFKRKLKKMVS